MSQLAIRPGLSAPFGAGVPHDVFDAAARRIRDRSRQLRSASMEALVRIRARLLEPGERCPRLEASYFETARMAREMYRL